MLLNQSQLLAAAVVANNRMNRARRCTGGNSYAKDLSFDLIAFLRNRSAGENETLRWLDICCGEGRALGEAAALLKDVPKLEITGIDLAGMFGEFPTENVALRLVEGAIEDFVPEKEFDLITCVHGLHYIGDKLSILRKAAGWLKSDGFFAANFDSASIKFAGGKSAERTIRAFLTEQNFSLDRRKHLIQLDGKSVFEIPYDFAGADADAGPNYTGQPAVDSFYHLNEKLTEK